MRVYVHVRMLVRECPGKYVFNIVGWLVSFTAWQLQLKRDPTVGQLI